MKALILTNAYYAAEEYLYAPRRIRDELRARGVEAEIAANDFFPYRLSDGGLKGGFGDVSFIIYYDKDKYVAGAAEKAGLRLYNRAEAIALADDKFSTLLCLADHGINLPRTLPGLLNYREETHVGEALLDKVESEFGYPVVVKECYGSLGRGVRLVKNREELKAAAESVRLKPHLFQEYVGARFGSDVRVMVAGGKAIGAVERRSPNDFRANVSLGGSARRFDADPETLRAAEQAASVMGLTFCGVDFLISENGLILNEVNSNPFFGGFEKATGINAAGHIADAVLSAENDRTF